jgi:hypothetical protein
MEELREKVLEEIAKDLGINASQVKELYEKPAFKSAIDRLVKEKEKAIYDKIIADEEEALRNHPEASKWIEELEKIEVEEVSLARKENEIKEQRKALSERRIALRQMLSEIAPHKYPAIKTAAAPKKEKGERKMPNWKAYMLGLSELKSATVKAWATYVRDKYGCGNEGDLWNNIRGDTPLRAAINEGLIDVDETKKPAEFKVVGNLSAYI